MAKLNVKPRTIFCRDNLDILQGINSECIDLIYLDPPFNKNKEFSAVMGTAAEGAEFKDIFRREDVKDEWVKSIEGDNHELYSYLVGVKEFTNEYNYCYLVYMAIRLIECRRVLKKEGSIYLHCDSTMSHYLKVVLDCIFGEKNFRNEIVWQRNAGRAKGSQHAPKRYGANTDTIFFYAVSAKTPLNPFRVLTKEQADKKFNRIDEKGNRYQIVPVERGKNKGERPNLRYTFMGVKPPPAPNAWVLSKAKMQEEYEKGNIVVKDGKLERRKYIKDDKGVVMGNNWYDIGPCQGKEYTGYPTQKPLALLERVINASSKKGDVVFDPFCGCATTCVAAEKLGRQWIGADVSHKAYELVQERIINEVTLPLGLAAKPPHYSTTPPKRGLDEPREKGYVYIIGHPREPDRFKVGIAKNPESRLNQYQTGCPSRAYELLYKHLTPYYKELEKLIHEKFKADHEWVEGDFKQIKRAIVSGDKKMQGK